MILFILFSGERSRTGGKGDKRLRRGDSRCAAEMGKKFEFEVRERDRLGLRLRLRLRNLLWAKGSGRDILCFWWGNFNHGWTRMNTDAVGQF